MNKKMFLTAAWISILLLGLTLPVQAQAGITGVDPLEGTVGTEVTISGAGFGETQGKVLLGEEKCKVLVWSDTAITFLVDKPQPAGPYAVAVIPQKGEPMTFDGFAMRAPQITQESLVQDGNTATISGAFFGDRKGEARVSYRSSTLVVEYVKVLDWSMDTIRFELPDGLTGGFLLLVRNDVGAGVAWLGQGPPQFAPIYTQVSAGQWNTCAVRADDESIDCWGNPDHGITSPPVGAFKQVAVGSWHACGLKTDGTIKCWGREDGGRISGAPTGSSYTQISVGKWHGCAISTNAYGQSFADCWGHPDGTRTDDSQMARLVGSGGWHNCAVYADNSVACWGIEDDGRIGNAPEGNFKDVAVGDWHSCAVESSTDPLIDGHVKCWGDPAAGRVSPVPDPDLDVLGRTYTQVTAGNWHTCALRSDGTIACWGSNDDGRVSGTPVGAGFVQIEAGDRHTCAILDTNGDGIGTVYCWGNNGEGQCTPPAS